MDKLPFDIDKVLDNVRKAVVPYPKAALFELADEGYKSPFEILIACIISIRTRDETTLVCARNLFKSARTPAEISQLSESEIDSAIKASTFHEAKAKQIHEIAGKVVTEYEGTIPCEENVLVSFRGVGSKCAHLVLGIACGELSVSVDVHVHRITNRWGYIDEKTPEKSMQALEEKLPHQYHTEINSLLVPFGKHICTGIRPRCSTCPVLDWCRQVGVTEHR